MKKKDRQNDNSLMNCIRMDYITILTNLQRKQNITPEYLADNYARFYAEARRLQTAYRGQLAILVGVEIDWIRQSSQQFIMNLLDQET